MGALAVAVLVPALAFAQDDGAVPSELDLFELENVLNAQTTVASQKAKTVRDTPGVVTLVSREEIVASGARDLADVLMLVPGFNFGVDLENVVGLGFRGSWGHEGKVLLLVDGMEFNETLYSTLQFGQHFPVGLIQRVEVIRGPGSAVYGGNAELAVINVVTRGAKDLKGFAGTASWGQLGGGVGRRSLSLAWGDTLPTLDDVAVSVSASLGDGNRSDAIYRDFSGTEAPMAGASGLRPVFFNAGLEYRGLHARFVYDDYRVDTRDGDDHVLAAPVRTDFTSYLADARYDWKLADNLTLTPRVGYRRHLPWRTTDPESELFYDKSADRLTGRLTLNWEARENLTVIVGGEAAHDRAWLNDTRITGYQTLFGDQEEIAYQNFAAFSEVVFDNPIVNVVGGLRFEDHSAFGSSFVPRIGLMRRFGDVHLKLLYSRAFRAPSIENINDGLDIEPERTTVWEAEAGWQISDSAYVSANVYDISIREPILYFYEEDPNDPSSFVEGYRNSGRTGTRGLELEGRFKFRWGRATVAYSYYTAAGTNDVETYAVPGHDSLLLGFPTSKVTVLGAIPVTKRIALNPSAVLMSERYGYTSADAEGNPQLERRPPAALLNLFVSYRGAFVPGLDVGLGVYNLIGQRFEYLQPYNGSHAPLPGLGREVMLNIAYQQGIAD